MAANRLKGLPEEKDVVDQYFTGLVNRGGEPDLSFMLRHPYLSSNLLGGGIGMYGLIHGDKQKLYRDLEGLDMTKKDVPLSVRHPYATSSALAAAGGIGGAALGALSGDPDITSGVGLAGLLAGAGAGVGLHYRARKRFIKNLAQRMREMSEE